MLDNRTIQSNKYLFFLRAARLFRANKNYHKALELYSVLYNCCTSGIHQVYDDRLLKNPNGLSIPYPFNEFYFNSINQELENVDDVNVLKYRLYPTLVDEYAECLILLNNKKFNLQTYDVYTEMVKYNHYEIKYAKNKRYIYNFLIKHQNPYPYKLFLLSFGHVFKSGSFKGWEVYEVELEFPEKIYPMITLRPNIHSASKLDLIIDMQFFLSKYRKRNQYFFSALEANYAKIQAIKHWCLKSSFAEYMLELQGYYIDSENDKWEEINTMYSYSERDMIDDAFEGDWSNYSNTE
jgi:hypothetical protein